MMSRINNCQLQKKELITVATKLVTLLNSIIFGV